MVAPWGAFLGCRFHADKLCLRVSYCTYYTLFLHSRKGKNGCMERIAIAMQDGGAGAGAQHGGAGREANLIFLSCRSTSIMGPPVGGLFSFKSSSRPHPRKFGVKRFLVVRGVAGAEVGSLFLGYLLGKNYRRRDRDHLVPPRRMDAAVCRAEVCYPFGRQHGRHWQ